MAFKLGTQEAVKKPISSKVFIPVCNEAGTPVNHQITMLYNRLTVEETGEVFSESAEEAKALDELSGMELTAGILDLHARQILRLAAGWKEVKGDDDGDVAFTYENVRMLLNVAPKAYDKLIEGFHKANRGGAARGN